MLGVFDKLAGWVAINDLLTSDEVAEIVVSCQRLLKQPVDVRFPGDKPAAGTRHLVELDKRIPLVKNLLGRSPLTNVITELLGPEAELTLVSYRSPQPGYGGQQLHADDIAKLDGGADRTATAIVALVDFTSLNGATRLVPGSHRRPDLQRHSGSLTSHPDEISLTGPAGTAFVFSGHLLHSGTSNTSGSERPALQITWRRSPEPS